MKTPKPELRIPGWVPAAPPSSLFSHAYLRQLLGVLLAYSLGLRLTLGQIFTPPVPSSARKFVNMLHTCVAQLKSLGVLRLEYEGFEPLCRLKGALFVANHPGTPDALVLIEKIPHLTCLMRSSLLLNPIMRGAARMTGSIPNDVGASFIHQAERKLKSGENLLIFPEGTRTSPGVALNPFKKGFALIAVRNQFPLHTIRIERRCSYFSKNVSLFTPTELPIVIRLKAGKTFLPEPQESAREFALRIQDYFQSSLKLSGNAIRTEREVSS